MRENAGFLPHIESLRAIAVISVVINHINHAWLPGGYLGVDIFFVISGFVITRSLLKQESASMLSRLCSFYVKRIKRLLPALVLVVIAAVLLLRLVAPSPQVANYTAITALFGVSNIFLYLSAVDYFGESNTLNPLMHTWSLGVEEQFYLVFPAIVFLTLRNGDMGKTRLLVILALASVISFMGFASLYDTQASTVYYLPYFRIWELGVGCLLALLALHIARPLALLLQAVASLGIAVAFLIAESFPVVSAVLAVSGAAGLILSGTHPSVLHHFMSAKAVQYIGRLSYSLYLWHWVIICLVIWTVGINWVSIIFIGLASLGMASLSFHLLEEPARRRRWFAAPTANLLMGAGIMVFGVSCVLLMNKFNIPQFSGNYDAAMAAVGYKPGEQAPALPSQRKIQDCSGVHVTSKPENLTQAIQACHAASVVGPRLVFFGDSHTLDMFGAAEVLYSEKAASVINFWQVGCQTPSVNDKNIACNYPEIVMAALPALQANQRGYVVLRSNYNPKAIDGTLGQYLSRIRTFYEKMRQYGYELIYIAPAPKFPALVTGGLCTEQWYRPKWAISESCSTGASVSRIEELGRRQAFYQELKALEKQNPQFHVFDPFDVLCGGNDKKCLATHDGVPFYRDKSHLTIAGSEAVGYALGEYLQSIN